MKETIKYTYQLLEKYSLLLNNNPDIINIKMINKLSKSAKINDEESMHYLLASYLELEDNKVLLHEYYPKSLKKLNIDDYINNPYNQMIKINEESMDNWQIEYLKYHPYELFVYDDFIYEDDKFIPQIGYFDKTYKYLTILENNRIWMLITPNEINTMKEPITKAKGNVVTFGLGLGYFAFMCSLKEDVKKITIVECNEKVISLFKQKILPLFLHQEKIEIVQMDAYDYAKEHLDPAICDYVFIDLWHDASDGMDIYLKFLQIERDDINYDYWIEKTIIFYLLSSLENIEEFLNNHNQLNYLEIRKKLKKNFENHCNFKKK